MELTFDDFKSRANDSNLSKWEKIGFPNSYRKDKEDIILSDITIKLALTKQSRILDIGCGCSDLVKKLIIFSNENNHKLFLNDSEEMLSNIPDNLISSINVVKIPGEFPKEFPKNDVLFDAIIVYSVIQYPFISSNVFSFIHSCLNLLEHGGKLLIGDIPNFSKRERFLNSAEGEKFRMNSVDLNPSVTINHQNYERIDDTIIFSIMQRFRNFGYETYLLPQSDGLPFANRREDILIVKRNEN